MCHRPPVFTGLKELEEMFITPVCSALIKRQVQACGSKTKDMVPDHFGMLQQSYGMNYVMIVYIHMSAVRHYC